MDGEGGINTCIITLNAVPQWYDCLWSKAGKTSSFTNNALCTIRTYVALYLDIIFMEVNFRTC